MSKRFFDDSVSSRVGSPTVRLMRAAVRELRKSNRKITRSDFLRIAIIDKSRKVLGSRADEILVKGIEIGGRR